jgi:hypothetical protein
LSGIEGERTCFREQKLSGRENFEVREQNERVLAMLSEFNEKSVD